MRRVRGAVVLTAAALLAGCSYSVAPVAQPQAGIPPTAGLASPGEPVASMGTPTASSAGVTGLTHPHIPAVDFPNRILTPGVALAVTILQICTSGYASRTRDVPQSEKDAVYGRYGVVDVPYQHEVDHLISLELGGSNDIRNLWPEPYAGRWGARTKDVLENRLHYLVCSGALSLWSAQHQEAGDWVTAYERYVGGTPAAPGSGSGTSGSVDPGGYYASSYPTASTIYCADDSTWRELSTTYLVHFQTLAQALARFPSYHLHRPC